ncbi:alpha/beta hydrolase [Anaerobacillus alkaliphilus]|uniref:Alpha/beta hydrolase n=1 Tax=Anaerobacillus alkaliphilus TaxID=1548597 RepID=A0A4Q0VQX6_9BACI|nr:alpha/beta hydrolase [Anaerobacillus alkaliphilus]RXI98658.1 alpha/beta hydrolase [Anaerobacillus alkaliphilus]
MWVWESKDAKAVFVLVHGANEHHVRYQWLVQKLINEGFHVVMGDLPGQGRKPKARGHVESFQEYIDTIEEWYKRAQEFHLPIFLLGHSMGGLAVIQTMLQKKLDVNAIILSSPCLGLVNPPSKFLQYSAIPLNKFIPKLRLATNLAQVTRCEEMLKRDESDIHMVKKVSIRWFMELKTAMANSHRDVHNFPNVPLAVLQGGDDLIVDKSAVLDWFHNVPLTDKYYKEFPGLYHEVFNEPEKETVFEIAKGFMESHL